MSQPEPPRMQLAYSVNAVACPDPQGRPGWVQIVSGEGVGAAGVLQMPADNVEGWLEVYVRTVRHAAEQARRAASGIILPGLNGQGVLPLPRDLQGPPPGHPG